MPADELSTKDFRKTTVHDGKLKTKKVEENGRITKTVEVPALTELTDDKLADQTTKQDLPVQLAQEWSEHDANGKETVITESITLKKQAAETSFPQQLAKTTKVEAPALEAKFKGNPPNITHAAAVGRKSSKLKKESVKDIGFKSDDDKISVLHFYIEIDSEGNAYITNTSSNGFELETEARSNSFTKTKSFPHTYKLKPNCRIKVGNHGDYLTVNAENKTIIHYQGNAKQAEYRIPALTELKPKNKLHKAEDIAKATLNEPERLSWRRSIKFMPYRSPENFNVIKLSPEKISIQSSAETGESLELWSDFTGEHIGVKRASNKIELLPHHSRIRLGEVEITILPKAKIIITSPNDLIKINADMFDLKAYDGNGKKIELKETQLF